MGAPTPFEQGGKAGQESSARAWRNIGRMSAVFDVITSQLAVRAVCKAAEVVGRVQGWTFRMAGVLEQRVRPAPRPAPLQRRSRRQELFESKDRPPQVHGARKNAERKGTPLAGTRAGSSHRARGALSRVLAHASSGQYAQNFREAAAQFARVGVLPRERSTRRHTW